MGHQELGTTVGDIGLLPYEGELLVEFELGLKKGKSPDLREARLVGGRGN